MISDKIEYIDLVLENCDYYRIYADDVHYITLDNISNDIGVNIVGQYWDHKVAEYAYIEVSNKDFKTSWQTLHDIDIDQTFIERIMIKDITSMVIAGRNDRGEIEEYQFYVKYREKNEGTLGSSNLWQKNIFNEKFISIEIMSRDKKQWTNH